MASPTIVYGLQCNHHLLAIVTAKPIIISGIATSLNQNGFSFDKGSRNCLSCPIVYAGEGRTGNLHSFSCFFLY